MQNEPSYYAVIPAEVRYCEKMSMGAKLLFGEITSLCNQTGYCWATNQYFAELYKKTTRTICNWIIELEENSFIISEIKEGNTRHIRMAICVGGLEKNFVGVGKKFRGGVEKNFLPTNNKYNNINESEGERARAHTHARVDESDKQPQKPTAVVLDSADEFHEFKGWLTKFTPRIERMEQPFNQNQFRWVMKWKNYDDQKLKRILVEMDNWKPLLDKKVSAYTTLKEWYNREKN